MNTRREPHDRGVLCGNTMYRTRSVWLYVPFWNFYRVMLHDGFTLLAKDAFIYGGAITLELKSYITDRIVLLANVREGVLWGGSLGKFSTQFCLGTKL